MLRSPVSPVLGAPALALALAASVGVAWWLYRDARTRGSDRPGAWAACWLLFSVAGLAHYLLVRGRLDVDDLTAPSAAALVSTAVIGVSLAFLVAALLSPPDPFSQMRLALLALPAALPLAYALRVAVPLGRDLSSARRE
ncbi:hypothetical protein [Halomicrobium salinisoli]|uniref:hypothetical protein n=1 Tax=Halomicrobium salinisoli TaxID=2878391 RepID=UPI001CEFC5B7|nr:hypothetical protein [Halomicrobium salinisoli]